MKTHTDVEGASHAFTGPVVKVGKDTLFWCRRCQKNLPLTEAAMFRCWGQRIRGVCMACILEEH